MHFSFAFFLYCFNNVSVKGPIIIYRQRGGLGLNKMKFSRPPPPPSECYFTKVIPLITFDDFRDPPHMASFSNQIWVVPALNPSKVFSDPPPFPRKNQVIRLKILSRPLSPGDK